MTASLRLLIVDDEPLATERLRILLGRLEGVEIVGAAETGAAALRLAQELAPDACLLDIGMPQMDGVEVARHLARLDQPPKVVFVTAYDSFAVVAFDVDAVDYIVKPVNPVRLERALARIRQHMDAAPRIAPADDRLIDFWASDQHGLTRIAVEDVDRITAERDYMRLHVGRRSWLVNDSLARLEQQLDAAAFVRLHRGAIVRRSFISGFRCDDGRWTAELADGSEQKVGRSYADNARLLAGRRRAR